MYLTLEYFLMLMNSGAVFKERREKIGLSLQDAARATKIKPIYLQAIEEWNIGIFPGETYLRGYMRTYAHMLSIDETPLT